MTDDELLALARSMGDDESFLVSRKGVIALIERHRAERNGFEMVREQMAATIARHVEEKDALRSEVERLTREIEFQRTRARSAEHYLQCACDDIGEQQRRAEAAESALAAEHEKKDGMLISCPWCHADMSGKISDAPMYHLINCGDKYRGEAQAALAAERKRVGVLEVALRWYAEEWRYSYDNDCCFDGINPERYKNGGKPRNPDSSENGVIYDNGERARAALAESDTTS